MAGTIRTIRPRLVLVENVPGLNAKSGSRPGESALGTVIADLAEAGYVGSWIRLRASAVGAPHIRERIFILAADASRLRRWEVTRAALGDESSPTGRAALADHQLGSAGSSGLQAATLADAWGERLDGRRGEDSRRAAEAWEDRWQFVEGYRVLSPHAHSERLEEHTRPVAEGAQLAGADRGSEAPTDADSSGRGVVGVEESGGIEGARGRVSHGRGQVRKLEDSEEVAADSHGDGGASGSEGPGISSEGRRGEPGEGRQEWGLYEPAVRRWEYIFGRPAPNPTDDRGRLMPEFVEWMMGFPQGWTEGESRTARLRMLGNAVQVQVGEEVGLILRDALG